MCSGRLIQQLRDQREWQAHEELQEEPGLLLFTSPLNDVSEGASAVWSRREGLLAAFLAPLLVGSHHLFFGITLVRRLKLITE